MTKKSENNIYDTESKDAKILLAHGSGGKLYHDLVEEVFLPAFDNQYLAQLSDAAALPFKGDELAFTTDSFVVNPLFFPDSNIGHLAICGTVNDIAMSGAEPLYISCGFIIEEGLPIRTLKKIVQSMADVAKEANVQIVTGDTKIVAKGQADKVFINTCGIGAIKKSIKPTNNVNKGDIILINGNIAEHGAAVMAAREGIDIKSIKSDAAPLYDLVKKIQDANITIKTMRDPTRGGIASVMHEWCSDYGCGIELNEEEIPKSQEVESFCAMLGLDPLYVANEGKVLMIIDKNDKEQALKIMQQNELGRKAAIIGEITKDFPGNVSINNIYGGKRLVPMLTGDLLPRIC